MICGVVLERGTMNKTIDGAVYLAISTAILYSWSTAFYHGYLGIANLDSDMMERSFHQILYTGLVISYMPIVLGLLGAFSVCFAYGRLIVPEYVRYMRKGFKQRRRVIKLRNWWFGKGKGKKKDTPIEIKEKLRSNYFGLLLFLSVFYVVSLDHFQDQGRKEARRIIGTYFDGKRDKYREIKIVKDGASRKLLFLGCGAKNCAGLEEVTDRIFYFPQSIGYSFIYNTNYVKTQAGDS